MERLPGGGPALQRGWAGQQHCWPCRLAHGACVWCRSSVRVTQVVTSGVRVSPDFSGAGLALICQDSWLVLAPPQTWVLAGVGAFGVGGLRGGGQDVGPVASGGGAPLASGPSEGIVQEASGSMEFVLSA